MATTPKEGYGEIIFLEVGLGLIAVDLAGGASSRYVLPEFFQAARRRPNSQAGRLRYGRLSQSALKRAPQHPDVSFLSL
jgi:hypothetical protein